MNDVREQLRALDLLEPPAMWDASSRRQPRSLDDPGSPQRRRPVLAAAILVLTVVVLGSVLFGLGRLGERDNAVGPGPGPGQVIRYHLRRSSPATWSSVRARPG